MSYGKYANILVDRGYKVARVEQTETPDMLKERNDATRGKKDKVVRREMCSILSKGTRTYCHLDEGGAEDAATQGPASSVLFSIVERPLDPSSAEEDTAPVGFVEYGICAIDTLLSSITLAQFQDDKQLSRLRTMIARYNPTEVVMQKNNCCAATTGTISMLAPSAPVETLSDSEKLSVDQTLQFIEKKGYFEGSVPSILEAVMQGHADGSSALILEALGSALSHLNRSCIDHEIMSAKKFFAYVPPDMETSAAMNKAVHIRAPCMVLDAVALANLEVLVNNFDRTERGSLWSFINRCKTPFGKRILREWLCKPLVSLEEIALRRGAVEELMHFEAEAEKVRCIFKKLPDVERLLSRVHCNGLINRSTVHPDARAIMFEPSTYNSRKIRDFADVLKSFEQLLEAIRCFENAALKSPQLASLAKATPAGKFPSAEMQKLLLYFRDIFDEKAAKKDGTITPKPGVNAMYDKGVADVKAAMTDLESHLKDLKKETGISSLCFFGNNKDRFQVEVPMASVNKIPSDWTCKSQKKTHRRYYTPRIEQLFKELQEAEGRIAVAQKDTLRSIFERFDQKSLVWFQALECASKLDALLALAHVSSAPGYCWPQMISSESPLLTIVDGRHPMLDQVLSERGDGDYIPNSVTLGKSPNTEEYARMLLVSGPNMGGKSTLLRQTCLIAIMAQLGCKVPATSCVMTPVDRIFTRVGASDRILSGQSTFFVELAETASILLNATVHSLCILDELGRGTATFDGTAIAHAVTDYLVTKTCCRALFATHYHSLVDDWEMDPRVRLGYMDCIVQARDDSTMNNDPDTVTFLYKLCTGSSPRSYGINVAKLAKLPDTVVQIAMKHSRDFEMRLRGEVSQEVAFRDFYVKYFERLVSIVNGIDAAFPEAEFVYFVQELWRRFKHVTQQAGVGAQVV